MEGNEVTMSKSGILDVLKDEEKSLQTQLVAIQRAIEAIEGAAGAPGVDRGNRPMTVVTCAVRSGHRIRPR